MAALFEIVLNVRRAYSLSRLRHSSLDVSPRTPPLLPLLPASLLSAKLRNTTKYPLASSQLNVKYLVIYLFAQQYEYETVQYSKTREQDRKVQRTLTAALTDTHIPGRSHVSEIGGIHPPPPLFFSPFLSYLSLPSFPTNSPSTRFSLSPSLHLCLSPPSLHPFIFSYLAFPFSDPTPRSQLQYLGIAL